jgi:hypothetical protein
MTVECLMTEDCPGYDRERQVCLLRPEDCEFAPADRRAAPVVEAPDAPTPGTTARGSAGLGRPADRRLPRDRRGSGA